MKKTDKPVFVQKLAPKLKAATSVVLLDYTGLSVKKQQELKKRLKKISADMLVVKNTLLRLAGKEAKISEESLTDSVLSGPTAMVITEGDPIAPLQVLYKFAKEFEVPQFKVGIVEGKFQDKDSLAKLAQLPNKDVLFGQVVGAVASPMYGLVGALQGNIQKLLYVLKAKAAK
jgi:large subunit ribosomal protein L10